MYIICSQEKIMSCVEEKAKSKKKQSFIYKNCQSLDGEKIAKTKMFPIR